VAVVRLGYETYAGLEAEASAISAFQSPVIHGLLQTAEYARAGHESAMPKLDPDQIDLQIEAKLTRQDVLTRVRPPRARTPRSRVTSPSSTCRTRLPMWCSSRG
jgi:hypothetical protein